MIDELNNSLHAEDSIEGMKNRLAAIQSVLSNWGVSTVSHRKVQLDVATSVVKKMIGRRGNKLYQVGSVEMPIPGPDLLRIFDSTKATIYEETSSHRSYTCTGMPEMLSIFDREGPG